MELVVRGKDGCGHFKCLPGFINILKDWKFMVSEYDLEVYRDMCFYEVYIKQKDDWLDLIYAYKEGFLDPSQLRNWP